MKWKFSSNEVEDIPGLRYWRNAWNSTYSLDCYFSCWMWAEIRSHMAHIYFCIKVNTQIALSGYVGTWKWTFILLTFPISQWEQGLTWWGEGSHSVTSLLIYTLPLSDHIPVQWPWVQSLFWWFLMLYLYLLSTQWVHVSKCLLNVSSWSPHKHLWLNFSKTE